MDQIQSRWPRIAIAILFLLMVAFIFKDGTIPLGRDWVRYWHPYFEYFSRNGPVYGVLWQLGGGILPIYDPSTFLFDPLFLAVTKYISYPSNTTVYVLSQWMFGVFAFESFLEVVGVGAASRLVGAIAFGWGGLSLSLVLDQFYPLYFRMPIMALALFLSIRSIHANEKQSFSTSLKQSCLLAANGILLAWVGYTAVPNVFVFLLMGVYLSLSKFRDRKIWMGIILWSTPLLSFPYVSLIYAKISNLTPDSYLAQWAFHPARLLSLILPEFIVTPSRDAYWMNFMFGISGGAEPYFRSITLPMVSLTGLFCFTRSAGAARWLVLGITLLASSMVGLAPTDLHTFISKIPIFAGRYHEKFLIGAIPILLAVSAISFSRASIKKRGLGLFMLFAVALGVAATDVLVYPKLIKTMDSWAPGTYLTIAFQFVCLLFSAFFYIRFQRRIATAFFVVSIFGYAPVAFVNLRQSTGELGVFAFDGSNESEFAFIREFGKRIERESLFIHPDAELGNCLHRSESEINPKCDGFLSGGWLGLMSYMVRGGYTSFYGFRDLVIKSPQEVIVATKPRFVVVRKDRDPRQFCLNLIRYEQSIVNCTPVFAKTYSGPLALVEVKHMNEVQVISHGDPYRIDLKVKARYSKVRVPFLIPPGGEVILDGTITTAEKDTFGSILNVGQIDKARGYSEHAISITYGGRVLETACRFAIASLLLCIFFTAAMVKGRKVF